MTTPNEALRTILPIAGWSDRRAGEVAFTGGADPVLPTPFRVGAAGAAIRNTYLKAINASLSGCEPFKFTAGLGER